MKKMIQKKISKTINSVYKIDKNLPLTIVSSLTKFDLSPIIKNVEIVNYNKSEGLLRKINDLLIEISEAFILFINSGDELEKGAIEVLKVNITKIYYNMEIAAVSFDDKICISNNLEKKFKPKFSPRTLFGKRLH